MFEITEETKREAIIAMREALLRGVDETVLNGLTGNEVELERRLGDAFDVAVVCVKRQFGM